MPFPGDDHEAHIFMPFSSQPQAWPLILLSTTFFSSISGILENVLLLKMRAQWLFNLFYSVLSSFHSKGDDFLAFSSALVGILNKCEV